MKSEHKYINMSDANESGELDGDKSVDQLIYIHTTNIDIVNDVQPDIMVPRCGSHS